MSTHAPAGKRIRLIAIALFFLITGCSPPPGIPLKEVKDFGSNPGELRMLKYLAGSFEDAHSSGEGHEVPATHESSTPGLPLVVALHGCIQDAAEYGESSGWTRLADRWGFLLLLPEQRSGNHLTRCFNWYSTEDHRRKTGEALSIAQMVAQMRLDHPVDPQRIFVTGVSAGAAMTLALVAAYPEIFAGGAPLAGIPFGCADGLVSALVCMADPPDKEAAEWGAAVRAASSHRGPWPRLSVWQGDADSAVDPANATAILRQWTDVHGIDVAPAQEVDPRGHVRTLYLDANQQALLESNLIKGMGHGVPVDPGPGDHQCGKDGKFFPDMDICSSISIADFWGLSERHEADQNP